MKKLSKKITEQKLHTVYVMTNLAMPDYVKIGVTSNLANRLRSLYNTSVPLPFKCIRAVTMRNAQAAEKHLHNAFKKYHVGKEFFEIDGDSAAAALKALVAAGGKDVTPKELLGADEAGKRAIAEKEKRTNRAAFSFVNAKIEAGAQLTFKNKRTITATVIDAAKNKIECPAVPDEDSLSATATKILGFSSTVAGPNYWMYEGKTLTEIKDRINQDENV